MPPEKKIAPSEDWIYVTHSVVPKGDDPKRVTREYFDADLSEKGWTEVKDHDPDASPSPTATATVKSGVS